MRFLARTLLIISALLVLSSCGAKLSFNAFRNSKFTTITGTVPALQGLVSVNSGSSFHAYASNCEAWVNLYKLDSSGKISFPSLGSASVKPDGSYALKAEGLDSLGSNVEHILEVSTSGSCDLVLQRPLTQAMKQDITVFSTIVSFGKEAELSQKLNQVALKEMEKLLENTTTITTAAAAYQELLNNRSAQFTAVFSDPVTKLAVAAPLIKETLFPPALIDEGSINNFSVSAYHWKPDYSVAVVWKYMGQIVSQTPSWTFTPNGNASGNKILEVFVGRSDGAGGIDTTVPYHYFSHDFTIVNTTLPASPLISTSVLITRNAAIDLQIHTGAGMSNCQSFSSMAVTIDDFSAPLYFLIPCDTPNVQLLPLVLTGGDGIKTIRLWTRDSLGDISAMPSVTTVRLDTTSPTIDALAQLSPKRGSETIIVPVSVSDAGGISSITAELFNGSTYQSLGPVPNNQSSISITLPSVNTTSAKIRITATDLAGNSSSLESSHFEIDSTQPASPTATLASSAVTKNSLVNLNIANCSGITSVFIAESSTIPALSNPGWVSCTATVNYTLQDRVDGQKTLHVYSRDEAGNISPSRLVQLTWDNSSPEIILGSLSSPVLLAGAHLTLPITVSEPNISSSQLVNLSYSTDDGATFTHLSSLPAANGSLSVPFTVPQIDAQSFRFKASVVDLANNTATSLSQVYKVDHSGPVVSQFRINGATDPGNVTNNNLKISFDAVDSISPVTKFCLRYNVTDRPPGNDPCWTDLTSIGLAPGPSVRLDQSLNYYFRVGYGSAAYQVYLWAKDGMNNISTNPGMIGLNYQAPLPPSASILSASRADAFTLPITTVEATVPNGSNLFVKWKITGTIANAELEISYNETTWTTLASNLLNSAGAGCTINEEFTGCLLLPGGSPSSSYYRLRLKTFGSDGSFTYTASNPVNAGGFRIIAGNTSETVDGAARSAVFNPSASGDQRIGDMLSMVVADDGTVYVADGIRGLLRINPSDGILKVVIPVTSGSVTDGPITNATVKTPSKIIFDNNGDLLLWDAHLIRRIRLSASPVTIETIIGGGPSIDDTVANPLSISMTLSYRNKRRTFAILPDNSLLFESEGIGEVSSTKRYRLLNSADGTVSSLKTLGDYQLDSDVIQFGTCHKGSLVPVIRNGIHEGYLSQYYQNGSGACAPSKHFHFFTDTALKPLRKTTSTITQQIASNILLGRDKKIYHFNKGGAVGRYDPDTDSWSTVLGNGKTGFCEDGTPISECPLQLDDVFVTSTGKYYLLDNNIIRTVTDDNKILTLYGKSGHNTITNGVSPLTIVSSGIVSADVWMKAGVPNVVAFDNQAAKILEFGLDGNLTVIAGNGMHGPPLTTVAATETSMTVVNGNSRIRNITVDPVTGDIFSSPTVGVWRLSRSTQRWSNFFGSGTGYTSADGLSAQNITPSNSAENGYGPLGIANDKLIVMHVRTVSSVQRDAALKGYDLTSNVQSHILGSLLPTGSTLCTDGTSIDGCAFTTSPSASTGNYNKLTHDPTLGAYLFPFATRVRLVPENTGNISTLFDLGRSIKSIVSYRVAGRLNVIACEEGGKLYLWEEGGSVATQLPWPSSSITCEGTGLVHVPTRNSIIFTFKQNNLTGIAEYRL